MHRNHSDEENSQSSSSSSASTGLHPPTEKAELVLSPKEEGVSG